VLADGRELRGDIFVHPTSRFRAEQQTAGDFLNEEDSYFAFAMESAAPILIAKENVLHIDAELPASEDMLDVPRAGLNVEVTLTSGAKCVGSVFPDTRADRARLIDYLNSYGPRFLALFGAGRVTLVNRRAVVHVRETR
jgi:hypothetical protein